MGAQWKVSGKAAKSNAQGAMFSKLAKEISVAAKLGGPEVGSNPRLRAAVESAKKQSMPRDTIERNIKKGAGLLDEKVTYETLLFEGFAPHKVPVIVECLTDNKNRTNSDIRVLFRKAQLGNSGSVAYMFDHLGLIEATHAEAKDPEEAAIECGAQNVEPMGKDDLEGAKAGAVFYTEITDLNAVSNALSQAGWKVTTSELGYKAKNNVELSEEQMKEVSEFLQSIDNNDDVHRVYAAVH
ncbi:MAG: YebC/PmpR family DNA-binding transcriptional regulator [Proteobacteria bacterium]|nr:MAG: YebC/PmpR family DNA-binding transcriptional regulator [Pseudomonadota bacterium]